MLFFVWLFCFLQTNSQECLTLEFGPKPPSLWKQLYHAASCFHQYNSRILYWNENSIIIFILSQHFLCGKRPEAVTYLLYHFYISNSTVLFFCKRTCKKSTPKSEVHISYFLFYWNYYCMFIKTLKFSFTLCLILESN